MNEEEIPGETSTQPVEPQTKVRSDRAAKASAAGKGLDRYVRHGEVTAKLKAFCENPDNFSSTGPRTLYDLSGTLSIGYATLSRNLQIMHAKVSDAAVLEGEKFNSHVRVWPNKNGIWVWCESYNHESIVTETKESAVPTESSSSAQA